LQESQAFEWIGGRFQHHRSSAVGLAITGAPTSSSLPW
jgi:hypothetical protein